MTGNISEGWRRLGCDVTEFFYGTHMGKSWDVDGRRSNRDTNAALYQTAVNLRNSGRLDLIFCVIYDDVLEVETARRLRALGVPMVNYHVDLVGQWYRVIRTGKYFDRLACAHEDHWSGLSRADIRPYYMPMAANLPPRELEQDPAYRFEGVTYLGSPWGCRPRVLGGLLRHGFSVRIYGNNWSEVKCDASNTHHWRKNLHDLSFYALARVREEGGRRLWRSVMTRFARQRAGSESETAEIPASAIKGRYVQEDFPRLVQGAEINLGFTHFLGEPGTSLERRQVRLREFEIPICGGFYLTQDCPQVRSLFKPGVHLDVWDKFPDLCEKIAYYQCHSEKRRQIAEAGREHAFRHHTWIVRFSGLLRELGIAIPQSTPAE